MAFNFFALILLLIPLSSCESLQNETIGAHHNLNRRQATSGCNFNYQFNQVGQSALLRSPNYPGNYANNLDCRYTLTSPQGTQMTVQCTEFNLESSQNCQYDVFFVSPSGDPSFNDQQFFCGNGGFTRTTQGNRLTIGFHTDESNPASNAPFRFQCQISVTNAAAAPQTCSCGTRNLQSRIVGGTNAAPGEFPWRCALYSRTLGVFCGCTIISNKWILTAAHCTNGVPPGEEINVDVGDHDLSTNTEAMNQLILVDYVVQNNLYNDKNQDSDISLLRLSRPLNFTRNISPVCLPWKFVNENFHGKTITASGWGSIFYGSGISSVLQKVDISVVGNPQCGDYYASSGVTITNNMICTYSPPRDTCQGDSGTSIDYMDPGTGRYFAIGVTSLGVGCGAQNRPGIYTAITRYLNWIQGNTGETFCRM